MRYQNGFQFLQFFEILNFLPNKKADVFNALKLSHTQQFAIKNVFTLEVLLIINNECIAIYLHTVLF